MINKKEIPKSGSDLILETWGYNLVDEYLQLISSANFNPEYPVFDIATGTGRAASVLTRLGFNVITGDYELNKQNEAERRITPEFLPKVKFMELNIETLPFNDNSTESIVCINTIHELENPEKGINELIRTLSPNGKLLIADFNPEGFDVMDKLHLQQFGKMHPRGNISYDRISLVLKDNFSSILEIKTSLNNGLLAADKIDREMQGFE